MWHKSNNITAFALDLKSAYEGEHKIFGLLSLANLSQDKVLKFYSFEKFDCHTQVLPGEFKPGSLLGSAHKEEQKMEAIEGSTVQCKKHQHWAHWTGLNPSSDTC
jgi:hypothetical protein